MDGHAEANADCGDHAFDGRACRLHCWSGSGPGNASARAIRRADRTTDEDAGLVSVRSCPRRFLGGWVSTNYAVLACADFPGLQRYADDRSTGREGVRRSRASWDANADGSFLRSRRCAPSTGHNCQRAGYHVAVVAAAPALMRAHAAPDGRRC